MSYRYLSGFEENLFASVTENTEPTIDMPVSKGFLSISLISRICFPTFTHLFGVVVVGVSQADVERAMR